MLLLLHIAAILLFNSFFHFWKMNYVNAWTCLVADWSILLSEMRFLYVCRYAHYSNYVMRTRVRNVEWLCRSSARFSCWWFRFCSIGNFRLFCEFVIKFKWSNEQLQRENITKCSWKGKVGWISAAKVNSENNVHAIKIHVNVHKPIYVLYAYKRILMKKIGKRRSEVVE